MHSACGMLAYLKHQKCMGTVEDALSVGFWNVLEGCFLLLKNHQSAKSVDNPSGNL